MRIGFSKARAARASGFASRTSDAVEAEKGGAEVAPRKVRRVRFLRPPLQGRFRHPSTFGRVAEGPSPLRRARATGLRFRFFDISPFGGERGRKKADSHEKRGCFGLIPPKWVIGSLPFDR